MERISAHVEGPALDRLDALRASASSLTPESRVVAVSGRRVLLRDGAPLTEPAASVDAGAWGADGPVLLGEREGIRYAARAVAPDRAEAEERRTGGRFEGLRSAATLLSAQDAGLVYYAAGLLGWLAGSRHCGSCGRPTRVERLGHQRTCTWEECGAVSFPRADPAIITLLRRDDRALLIHQPPWPEGRYSTLAGFVEPGETLEQAVAREVSEEVGLPVERTRYFASQPWPFPHTLMIGFRAWAGAGEVALGDEVDDAVWLTRSELRDALDDGRMSISSTLSVSRSLIDDWLEE
jgi:NAD+ diphosphatase